MRLDLDPYCDVGPGLLLDERAKQGWSQRTFGQAILDAEYIQRAASGECVFLKDEGARYFSGKTVVLIEEPRPEWTRFAYRRATGLRLELPTGVLRLVGLHSLVVDAPEDLHEDFVSVAIEPGRYRVDVYAFVPHRDRVEEPELLQPEERPLAGEIPDGPVSRWFDRAATLLTVTALGVVGGWLTLWRATTPLVIASAGLVLGMLSYRVALRLTGERQRRGHNAKVWKEHLSRLPEVPSYLICLWRDDSLNGAGGGLD